MPHEKGRVAVVFGSSSPKAGSMGYAEALELGGLLARGGWAVATGGYFGAMEAASRGAKEAGGRVIGVTTSLFDGSRPSPNAFLDEERRFPTLEERLLHLVRLGDAWIALPGGVGTLAEVALVWALLQAGAIGRRPFVLVGPMWREAIGGFSSDEHVAPEHRELVRYADAVADVPALLRAP